MAPVDTSVHWKPLRDPHYVLASLQRDQGGRRQVFANQVVFARLRVLARHGGEHLLGLLLGRQHDCPDTGIKYILIEALAESAPVPQDEMFIKAALAELLEYQANDSDLECLGWYAAGPSAERVAPAHAAAHTTLFKQPWQTVLILANNGAAGSFFLRDTVESRWFLAPFYEVTEQKRNQAGPKPTCTSWPTYLTTDSVAPFDPAPAAEPAS